LRGGRCEPPARPFFRARFGYGQYNTRELQVSHPTNEALGPDRQAVTALEYGLIAGVIVATIMFGFTLLAGDLSQQFLSIGNSVASS
jgi:Flp pilus assembly pilin Flp